MLIELQPNAVDFRATERSILIIVTTSFAHVVATTDQVEGRPTRRGCGTLLAKYRLPVERGFSWFRSGMAPPKLHFT